LVGLTVSAQQRLWGDGLISVLGKLQLWCQSEGNEADSASVLLRETNEVSIQSCIWNSSGERLCIIDMVWFSYATSLYQACSSNITLLLTILHFIASMSISHAVDGFDHVVEMGIITAHVCLEPNSRSRKPQRLSRYSSKRKNVCSPMTNCEEMNVVRSDEKGMFLLSTKQNTLYWIDDLGSETKKVAQLPFTICSLLYDSDRSAIYALTDDLCINQYAVPVPGRCDYERQVKLSLPGRPEGKAIESRVIGEGLLAITFGGPVVRLIDLINDDSTDLSVPRKLNTRSVGYCC
jgi:hypothetical protein